MNIQPNRFFQISLILLVALNLLPHINDYTVPTIAVGGFCLLWRLLYEYQWVPLPNTFVKTGLVLFLTYLVYENYGQILGLESGSALLICAVSLKLIDRVGYRDAMVLLFLNFMLLLARFLESQSLAISIFSGFDLILTTALLIQLHNSSKLDFNFWSLLKMGGKLFLQVAPFMILLFFVFPRFSGRFLQVVGYKRVQSGFSKEMRPGEISTLAQSDVVAFRAKLFDSIPSRSALYWRGSVLTKSQGMAWTTGLEGEGKALATSVSLKEGLHQEIMLEAHFKTWLFALDWPITLEQQSPVLQRLTRLNEGQVYSLSKDYGQKFIYDVYSQLYSFEIIESVPGPRYLQVPKENDKRLQKLLRSIQIGGVSNEAKAMRLMNFFAKEFRYTLSPGKLKTKTVSEFLFDKKVGFCEHFAASFASVMRLSGVPARVVLGFQGGVKNDFSDYYRVTSKDAHAWTEVWSKKRKRWIRFDPTSVVAPLRIGLGGQVYHSLSEMERLSQKNNGSLAQFNSGWFKQSVLAFDMLATNWNRFLLSYDSLAQKDFFSRFGLKNIKQKTLLLISLFIILFYFLWVRYRNRQQTQKVSSAHKSYLLLREKFLKKGLEKEMAEGPRDFLERCKKYFPHASDEIEIFKSTYLNSEYGLQEFPQAEMKKVIKKLKLNSPLDGKA